MSLKTINETFEEIKSRNPMDAMTDEGFNARIGEIVDEMTNSSEKALEILKRSMSEQDLAKLIFMCHKTIVAAATANGDLGLLRADLKTDLIPFSQTLVLTVIGILYE